MIELKSGARIRSVACETQIMVIKGIPGEHSLICGGIAMAPMDNKASAPLDPGFAEGTLLGKRYVNEAQDVELLCIKAGAGSLCLNGEMLQPKQAKILPSSD